MEMQMIEKREVGFRWHISIEKQTVCPTSSRASDKETVHASLEGHNDTYDGAYADLVQARDNLKAVIRELTKQEEKE